MVDDIVTNNPPANTSKLHKEIFWLIIVFISDCNVIFIARAICVFCWLFLSLKHWLEPTRLYRRFERRKNFIIGIKERPFKAAETVGVSLDCVFDKYESFCVEFFIKGLAVCRKIMTMDVTS